MERGKSFCSGRYMIEAGVAESGVGGASEKVYGAVKAGEIFKGGMGGGDEKVKFVKGFKSSRYGGVSSVSGRDVVHPNVREVSGG